MAKNREKFKQMYLYILARFGRTGVPKTKLAKLLYLADFDNYYNNLESMSGVNYVCLDYGPVADIFFETTDNLADNGEIEIRPYREAQMVESKNSEKQYGLLAEEDKKRLDKILDFWESKKTAEIVEFTHGQKPWKSCDDGERIPYSLIIQEDPNSVYAPITQ
jgi:hypothetical protein